MEFLHSDTTKTLDRAREAAMADARRKAEVYAHAGGLSLGGVAWVTEDASYSADAKGGNAARGPRAGRAAADLGRRGHAHVRITVGYDIAR